MDSTSVGFNLDFFNSKNYEDPVYKYCLIKFLIFHFLFLMLIISLLRTILTDPGHFEKEYVLIYYKLKLILQFY